MATLNDLKEMKKKGATLTYEDGTPIDFEFFKAKSPQAKERREVKRNIELLQSTLKTIQKEAGEISKSNGANNKALLYAVKTLRDAADGIKAMKDTPVKVEAVEQPIQDDWKEIDYIVEKDSYGEIQKVTAKKVK